MTLEERAREVAKELLEWSSQLAWDDHGLDEVDSNGYMSFATRHILALVEQVRDEVLDNWAGKCEEISGGIASGKLLPSCENPLLVSGMLVELAHGMRSRQRGKEGGE